MQYLFSTALELTADRVNQRYLVCHIERSRDALFVLDCARTDKLLFANIVMKIKRIIIAPMEAASPDLEKQGFLAVVYIYREYSAQRDELRTKQNGAAPKITTCIKEYLTRYKKCFLSVFFFPEFLKT